MKTLNPETRWTRGGWLVLAFGLLLIVWPLVTTLISFSLPSDGWIGRYDLPENRYFELQWSLTDAASPLREGDRVVAIDGQRFAPDHFPRLQGHRAGDVLHYTVLRDGKTIDIDVPLITLAPVALVRYNLISIQRGRGPTISLVFIACFIIPALVFLRRPGNAGARLLFLMFAYVVGEIWLNFPPTLSLYTPSAPFPLAFSIWFYDNSWSWTVGSSLILLALVFPVLKAPMRRFPRLLPFLLYGIPIVLLAAFCALFLTTFSFRWNVGITTVLAVVYPLAFVMFMCSLIHSLVTVHRPVARAQLLWMLLGMGVGFGGLLVIYIVLGYYQSISPNPESDPIIEILSVVSTWIILLVPISLAIAILRYRLFDIDVIIRRTLVYSVLTALLALVYFGSVVVLQQLFRGLTGQGQDLAIILSTLGIAGLFVPLRNRVQRTIDRRFYRSKYDAAHVLQTFAAAARDEVNLSKLRDNLIGVVEDTMQPESVSVWLREE